MICHDGNGYGEHVYESKCSNQTTQQPNNHSHTQNSAGPPPLPSKIYHVAINGQNQGPYTLLEIQDLIKNNTINRDSLFWKDGLSTWVPSDSIQEVKGLFGSVPPPLPI